MNFKDLYQNKNLYLLAMIVLLFAVTVLDSFELVPLVIRLLLITFFTLLIMRYQFLNYSIVFLILLSLLCLTVVFHNEFIVLLDMLDNKTILETYVLKNGAEITRGIILALFLWSFLAEQKVSNKTVTGND